MRELRNGGFTPVTVTCASGYSFVSPSCVRPAATAAATVICYAGSYNSASGFCELVLTTSPRAPCPAGHALTGGVCEHDPPPTTTLPPPPSINGLSSSGSVAAGSPYRDSFTVAGASASVSGVGCSLSGPSGIGLLYTLTVTRAGPGARRCTVAAGGVSRRVSVTFTGISGLSSSGSVAAGAAYADSFTVWGAAAAVSGAGCSLTLGPMGPSGERGYTLTVTRAVAGSRGCTVTGGGDSQAVAVTFTGINGLSSSGSVAAGSPYRDSFTVAGASASVSGVGCSLSGPSGIGLLYTLTVTRAGPGARRCTVAAGGVSRRVSVTFTGISGLSSSGSVAAGAAYADSFTVWGAAAAVSGAGCSLTLGPMGPSGKRGYTLTVTRAVAGSRGCTVTGGGDSQAVAVTFTDDEDETTTVPVQGCTVSLGSLGSQPVTLSGAWSASGGCVASHRGNAQTPYYARFYTFTLDAGARVAIDLSSSEDAYLFLLSGHGSAGAVRASNDDADDTTNDSRLSLDLAAGDYTIEATTFSARTTGSFTVTTAIEPEPEPEPEPVTVTGLEGSYDATVGEALSFSFAFSPSGAVPSLEVTPAGLGLTLAHSSGTATVEGTPTLAGAYVVTFAQPGRAGTDTTTVTAACAQGHTQQPTAAAKPPRLCARSVWAAARSAHSSWSWAPRRAHGSRPVCCPRGAGAAAAPSMPGTTRSRSHTRRASLLI